MTSHFMVKFDNDSKLIGESADDLYKMCYENDDSKHRAILGGNFDFICE